MQNRRGQRPETASSYFVPQDDKKRAPGAAVCSRRLLLLVLAAATALLLQSSSTIATTLSSSSSSATLATAATATPPAERTVDDRLAHVETLLEELRPEPGLWTPALAPQAEVAKARAEHASLGLLSLGGRAGISSSRPSARAGTRPRHVRALSYRRRLPCRRACLDGDGGCRLSGFAPVLLVHDAPQGRVREAALGRLGPSASAARPDRARREEPRGSREVAERSREEPRGAERAAPRLPHSHPAGRPRPFFRTGFHHLGDLTLRVRKAGSAGGRSGLRISRKPLVS